MLVEIKPGDIVKIGDRTGVVKRINTASGDWLCLEVDQAAIRANLPDTAVLTLMKLASRWSLRKYNKETLIRRYEGQYRDGSISPAAFDLIKPYLTVEQKDLYLEYSLNDDYWTDFVMLQAGDPVEILVDDETNRRTGRVYEVRNGGLYIGVEFDNLSGIGWFKRRSLRRVFERPLYPDQVLAAVRKASDGVLKLLTDQSNTAP